MSFEFKNFYFLMKKKIEKNILINIHQKKKIMYISKNDMPLQQEIR